MKRVIASRDDYSRSEIMKSDDGLYTLCKENGVGINDTHYEGLRVYSSGTAEDEVIEIRLQSSNDPSFNGEDVRYEYKGCYIAHGMRSRIETLDEIQQYIYDLQSAVDFAKEIEEYLPKWNNNNL